MSRTMPRLDDMDRRLLLALQAEPRAQYRALATALGVSSTTVANRLRRLESLGIMRVRMQPDLEMFGLEVRITALIICDLPHRTAVEELLSNSPNVLVVRRLTGEFDLLVEAVFTAAGGVDDFVRLVESQEGVRRLVVNYQRETVSEHEGWHAVWSVRYGSGDDAVAWLPEVAIPRHLASRVAIAIDWVNAFASCDFESLRRLSSPDITVNVMPPNAGVGTYRGINEVERQAPISRKRYRRVWYTPVAAHEGTALGYDFVIDALSPVELGTGESTSAFSRIAFNVRENRVKETRLLGGMDLVSLQNGVQSRANGRAS